jgi:isopentenyl-diphosphate delta-isomerase
MTETTAAVDRVTEEQVVLCSPDGAASGTAPKAVVHHRHTPLHLAFSCYVFDPAGRVLVTRRALTKGVFPGVRTNSCCGHPAPGESMRAAVRRRLRQELGVTADRVDLVLPTFRYRATAADGTVENELCPVYRVVTDDIALRPDAAEVDDAWWTPWAAFAGGGADEAGRPCRPDGTGRPDGDPLSPWAARQVARLTALGPDPAHWPLGEPSLLPSAAVP